MPEAAAVVEVDLLIVVEAMLALLEVGLLVGYQLILAVAVETKVVETAAEAAAVAVDTLEAAEVVLGKTIALAVAVVAVEVRDIIMVLYLSLVKVRMVDRVMLYFIIQ